MAQTRTVIASFPSSTKAEAAAESLTAAGLKDVSVRRNSRFGVTHDRDINDPVAHQAETLTGLTLYSANTPNDENAAVRVLMAADPSVSGYSALGYGLAGGEAFVLAAVVPEERVEEAAGIIKTHGGEV